MMPENANNLDNVEDFIEHKMIRMAEQFAKQGRDDIAATMYDALDAYLSGEVNIVFHAGMPYMERPEYIEENIDPSPREVDSEDENMP